MQRCTGNLAAGYCLKLRDANRLAHVDAVVPMPKLQVPITNASCLIVVPKCHEGFSKKNSRD